MSKKRQWAPLPIPAQGAVRAAKQQYQTQMHSLKEQMWDLSEQMLQARLNGDAAEETKIRAAYAAKQREHDSVSGAWSHLLSTGQI